jgi:transcriptional regulator with XRE-family HTH domain
MSNLRRITGRAVAAARALAGVSRADFAGAAGLLAKTLDEIEEAGSAWIQAEQDVTAILRGLDYYGVLLIDERDGLGAGVRLKFTRQDVRQIVRLEGEGGIVGSDDAP